MRSLKASWDAPPLHPLLRLGKCGKWLMRGIGVGGRPFTIQGVYREIDRPRLLVFTWLPSWQEGALESLVRVELLERHGVTVVRLTHSGLDTEGSRAQHRGWPAILARLKSHLDVNR